MVDDYFARINDKMFQDNFVTIVAEQLFRCMGGISFHICATANFTVGMLLTNPSTSAFGYHNMPFSLHFQFFPLIIFWAIQNANFLQYNMQYNNILSAALKSLLPPAFQFPIVFCISNNQMSNF